MIGMEFPVYGMELGTHNFSMKKVIYKERCNSVGTTPDSYENIQDILYVKGS